MAQTNNGLGDAWAGIRNRGGTPQHDRLKSHARPFPNSVGKLIIIIKSVPGKIDKLLEPARDAGRLIAQ
jgi:hypothetical protein